MQKPSFPASGPAGYGKRTGQNNKHSSSKKNHWSRDRTIRRLKNNNSARKGEGLGNNRGKDSRGRIEGVIRVSKYGSGFVDDPAGFTIRIEGADLNTALPGDTVRVLYHPGQKRAGGGKELERKGFVETVLSRARIQFVGTIKHDEVAGLYLLSPDDRRVYKDIIIVGTTKPTVGHKALVEMTQWKNPRMSPEGRILQILGKKGEHETEMAAVSLSHGFSSIFSPEAEREAREHEKNFTQTLQRELGWRRDFRNVPTVTIDPVDAKDFDDALSVRTLADGTTEVGIHIADVAFFVTPGSHLDKEATGRATSVYLVDRTIPMLPEALSNNICSLMPNEERLAFSTVAILTPNAQVKKVWFGRTVIRSQKRFSYEEAEAVLKVSGDGTFVEKLTILNDLAKKLRAERIKHGSVVFDKPEVKIVLDEKNRAIGVQVKTLGDSNRLVEEFMLLANRLVAEYIGKQKTFKAFVYRVHDLPNNEKIEMLGVFLRGMGYDFGGGKKRVSASDINALFSAIHGRDEESLIQTAALRSMAKAIYSTKNIGHFGLGFEYYTHFTSPIRRYPDTLVHRLLDRHLKGLPLASGELAVLESQARHSSEREQQAAEAERESVRFKQLEYMHGKVGQIFEGVISGMTDWGIFVEEKETKTEGMIRLSAMASDYYQFNEKTYSLTGSRTKKKFCLGDVIKVKLVRVDLETRELDWEMITK